MNHSSARLFQLISPSLPIGSFTYSQGLEWAYEAGWLADEHALEKWLLDLMQTAIVHLELPVLIQLHQAWQQSDEQQIEYWNQYLIASRETKELKQEEINRGRAMADIVSALMPMTEQDKSLIKSNQSCGFAYAVNGWHIDLETACIGFVWSWLENLVLAAVKIIPLGQTQGQQVLSRLALHIPELYQQTISIEVDNIGISSMALAIASSQHETQYTRLYRS